mmetsp:Transcript_14471/g.23555  ORF Transcript_14471/g.23555 Transcript_14471/m.23555 type:complete len:83 (-) Transcript_14471:252-500(-)
MLLADSVQRVASVTDLMLLVLLCGAPRDHRVPLEATRTCNYSKQDTFGIILGNVQDFEVMERWEERLPKFPKVLDACVFVSQ